MVQQQPWGPVAVEQWAVAIATPFLKWAHMDTTTPADVQTRLLCIVIATQTRTKARETVLQPRPSTDASVTWALQETGCTHRRDVSGKPQSAHTGLPVAAAAEKGEIRRLDTRSMCPRSAISRL